MPMKSCLKAPLLWPPNLSSLVPFLPPFSPSGVPLPRLRAVCSVQCAVSLKSVLSGSRAAAPPSRPRDGQPSVARFVWQVRVSPVFLSAFCCRRRNAPIFVVLCALLPACHCLKKCRSFAECVHTCMSSPGDAQCTLHCLTTVGVGLPCVLVLPGKVMGKWGPAGTAHFHAIPFAAPPVGQLRWQSPQPVQPWSGTLDGTEWGAPCMQPAVPIIKPPSEDCLTLNVFVPPGVDLSDPSPSLQVMFWICACASVFFLLGGVTVALIACGCLCAVQTEAATTLAPHPCRFTTGLRLQPTKTWLS